MDEAEEKGAAQVKGTARVKGTAQVKDKVRRQAVRKGIADCFHSNLIRNLSTTDNNLR
jgi:hypothetical protein